MRHIIFIFLLIVIASCDDEADRNISLADAKVKYQQEIAEKGFIIFPEFRENPLKWFDSIPENRIHDAFEGKLFRMNAHPGEYFVFQTGVWALNREFSDVQIEFTDLSGGGDKKISAEKITCFNKGGIDIKGNPFTKVVDVSAGRMQPLWVGIDLGNTSRGTYKGSVKISSGETNQIIDIALKVAGDPVQDHGYNEGARMSRLNWLNSRSGINNEVTKGFTAVKSEGNKLSILGRTMTIAENGLPGSYVSFFESSNQSINAKGESVVKNPFRFIIEKQNGEVISLLPGELIFSDKSDAGVNWKVINTSDDADLEVIGHLEFDGFVEYKLKLTAKKPIKVKDIRLEIPVRKQKAKYMMGLGHEGGHRTPVWRWKWDITKNQDMLWVGSVNGGMRIKWKAENYIRPLINIYYKFGPLNLPASWGNESRGGVDVLEKGDNVVINAYSGIREIKKGEVLNYNFELLLTPFRTIDRKNKFGERYFHGGGTNTSVKVEAAISAGANVINIHHAEDIYPFINYPYLDPNVAELKSLVNDAHEKNLRMKFYYTTRELTKNLPEFWAFYSLDGEIIYPGPGNESKTVINPKGPNEWLVKNLREKYIPAWYNVIKEGKFKDETDLSVITTPDSRLNNFYVAGLEWMVKNIGIDGVYIDDSALDRYTLQRARKIIDQYRPEGRIDLHSWNHFNEWAGFTNCLNLYMDLLPYLDLVWIGEGRDYNRDPDHWLIEVSGIPFGLPGQMLEGGGNPWRGMVYGITNRAGWVGNTPDEIWNFWDQYNITDKLHMGYWEEKYPVSSSNKKIFTSLFAGKGESILAVANWSNKDQNVSLNVRWKELGIDPLTMDIFIPFIKDFQDAREKVNLNSLEICAGKGLLLVIKNNK
jgi:Glycoside hydrolase 123, N-terminal domain